MASIAWLALILLLSLPVLPLSILRRRNYLRAREYFVASESTPPGVVQSSLIGYSLQLATFDYLFNLGARGDFWPPIAFSAMFGAGLYLIYRLRRPIIVFLKRRLAQDQSITIPAFIANQHGDDSRLRFFAAALTVVALIGLASTTALGFASLLDVIFHGGPIAKFGISCSMLALVAAYTIPGGNTGTMRAVQLQLGILYVGMFGSILLALYLLISYAEPMPLQGTVAVAALAICCAVVMTYRRSRYIDTSPIGRPITGEAHTERFNARLFRRISRVLNEFVFVLVAATFGLALMALFTESSSTAIAKGIGVSQKTGQMSVPALMGLALLPLFHPIVDTTNWLRIAALDDAGPDVAHIDPVVPVPFARIVKLYAGGSTILWLITFMFGTVAVIATSMQIDGDLLESFLTRLGAQQNEIADMALWSLLVSLFAMASITMSAMFSASLTVIRYDIIPSIWQNPESERAKPSYQAFVRRRTVTVGCAFHVAALLVLFVFTANSDLSLTTGRFFGLLLACLCTQLAFVPLVLDPLRQRENVSCSPAWAIAVLCAGVISGVGVVMFCLIADHEAWLWTAVPCCLGSGLFLFTLARLLQNKAAQRYGS